ncbi:DMT family transporter [Paenibacillus sp. TRM 82003]|nr:DMT family transporter [Paenibacillus sp. TRM 82003]
MILVGSSVVAGKLLTGVPVFFAASVRLGLATFLFLLLWKLRRGSLPRIPLSDLRLIVAMAASGSFLFTACALYGLRTTSASVAGALLGVAPALAALFAATLLKERLTLSTAFSALLATAGIAMLSGVGTPGEDASGSAPLGIGLLLLAATGESLFAILGKKLQGVYDPLLLSGFVSAAGFLMFLPFGAYEALRLPAFPTRIEWASLVYYAIVVTVLGYLLWFAGLPRVAGRTAGILTAVAPLSSALLAVWLLKESFSWGLLGGVAAIAVSIGLPFWRRRFIV